MAGQPICVLVAAAWCLTGAGAIAEMPPGKPLDLLAPPAAGTAPTPNVAENAKSRRERRADCEAQAQKLFSGQKKQFMKECMANKT